jgi:hypothetical protein
MKVLRGINYIGYSYVKLIVSMIIAILARRAAASDD